MDNTQYIKSSIPDLYALLNALGVIPAPNLTKTELIAIIRNWDNPVHKRIVPHHEQLRNGNKTPLPTRLQDTGTRKHEIEDDDNYFLEIGILRKLSVYKYPLYYNHFGYKNTEETETEPTAKDMAEMLERGIKSFYIKNERNKRARPIKEDIHEYLMTKANITYIGEVAKYLKLTKMRATIDTYYNLFWYINSAYLILKPELKDDEIAYISGLSIPRLIKLLGPNYKGPEDHASLIFAAISGKSTPTPNMKNIPRYTEIATYAPDKIWILAKELYSIYDSFARNYLNPPYIFVAMKEQPDIEKLFLYVNTINVDKMITDYQMIIPKNDVLTELGKVRFFKDQIKTYGPILNRKHDIELPILDDPKITRNKLLALFSPFTSKEILDIYEPTIVWEDRNELLAGIIFEKYNMGSIWSWRHNFCSNDDTFNVLDMDLHKDMNKDNLSDPTISYGIAQNYRCYQISELIAAWNTDDEGIFRFTVPDWTNKTKDNITNKMLDREFPIESVKQLDKLLEISTNVGNIQSLRNKIADTLLNAKMSTKLYNQLYEEYNNFDSNKKYLVKLYLSWLFMFGMWLRFWKGPGTPWPTIWTDIWGVNTCSGEQRNGHIEIQGGVKLEIYIILAEYPELKEWINKLPIVDYNFKTGEARMSLEGEKSMYLISELIEKMEKGLFCMAHGSDLILMSSYYLLGAILRINNDDEANKFINEMIPKMVEIEKYVVQNKINTNLEQLKDNPEPDVIKYVNTKNTILESRLQQLEISPQEQEPFIINKITSTEHVEIDAGNLKLEL